MIKMWIIRFDLSFKNKFRTIDWSQLINNYVRNPIYNLNRIVHLDLKKEVKCASFGSIMNQDRPYK